VASGSGGEETVGESHSTWVFTEKRSKKSESPKAGKFSKRNANVGGIESSHALKQKMNISTARRGEREKKVDNKN